MASGKTAVKASDKATTLVAPKKIVDAVREATGATDEIIQLVLQECNFDVNEATSRLIDNPWEVKTKKEKRAPQKDQSDKREGSRRYGDEPRRQFSASGRGRGYGGSGRGYGGGRGRGQAASTAVQEENTISVSAPTAPTVSDPTAFSDPTSFSHQGYSKTPGDTAVSAPSSSSAPAPGSAAAPAASGGWGKSGRSMADLFKTPAQPAAPASTPSASSLAPVPIQVGSTAVATVAAVPTATDAQPSHAQQPATNLAASMATGPNADVQAPAPTTSPGLSLGVIGQSYEATATPAETPATNAWGKPASASAPNGAASTAQGSYTSSLMSALSASQAPPTSQAAAPTEEPTSLLSSAPATTQAAGTDVGGLNLQFGQFGIGGNDFGSGFGNAFEVQQTPGGGAQSVDTSASGSGHQQDAQGTTAPATSTAAVAYSPFPSQQASSQSSAAAAAGGGGAKQATMAPPEPANQAASQQYAGYGTQAYGSYGQQAYSQYGQQAYVANAQPAPKAQQQPQQQQYDVSSYGSGYGYAGQQGYGQQASRQQYSQHTGGGQKVQVPSVSGPEASVGAPQQGATMPQMPYANPAAMASYGMAPYGSYMQYPGYGYMPNPYGYPQGAGYPPQSSQTGYPKYPQQSYGQQGYGLSGYDESASGTTGYGAAKPEKELYSGQTGQAPQASGGYGQAYGQQGAYGAQGGYGSYGQQYQQYSSGQQGKQGFQGLQ